MDIVDAAQEIEQKMIDNLLTNHKAKQSLISRHFCDDCGNVIPKARRAVIRGCKRCVDCQSIFEYKNKGAL